LLKHKKQVRQQDAYPANAGGGVQSVKTMCNNPLPFFKGIISVAHCMPLSTRLKVSKTSPPRLQT